MFDKYCWFVCVFCVPESACSQCSQGPSCPAKKQLQVTEEKYSDVIPAGCGVSENQCSRYVLLFHHLVKAYVKFYDLISVSRASKFGVEPTAESEPPSDAVDSQLCGELHEDVKTLRHLKTYCKLFEKHLRCLSPDMGDSPRLIQMLYLIVECSAGQWSNDNFVPVIMVCQVDFVIDETRY